MFFRILTLALLCILVFRAIRNVLKTVLNGFLRNRPSKKSYLNIDESQIQDAEFKDLDP